MPSFSPPGSSHITSAEHDPDTGMLHITFADGSTYAYKGVTAEKFAAFQQAPSAGSYFHRQIKGQHSAEKV